MDATASEAAVRAAPSDGPAGPPARPKQRRKRKPSTPIHFAAGLASGLLSAILLQPFDLLKTRVQQLYPSGAGAAGTAAPAGTKRPPAVRAVLASIFAPLPARQPFRELWRGTTPSTIRTGVGAALYFGWLDLLRREAVRLRLGTTAASTTASTASPSSSSSSSSATAIAGQLTQTANLLIGATARAAAGFVMMPVTVIKVHMESAQATPPLQHQQQQHPTLRAVAGSIWRAGGVRGFFAGSAATALRDAPHAGLYVVFYESAKRALSWPALSRGGDEGGSGASSSSSSSLSSSPMVTMPAGALAATAATVVTNPIDTVKTRLQLYPGRYAGAGATTRVGACLAELLRPVHRRDGPGGRLSARERVENVVVPVQRLFSGLGLRVVRKGLASAIGWTVYEQVVVWSARLKGAEEV